MITQDDIDKVLQLAEDELDHLRRDAPYDEDCNQDYIYSKAAFERVREYLTNEGRVE